MTSEQQVILLLSLVGVFWMVVGLWMKVDLERAEKRERSEGKVHPAE